MKSSKTNKAGATGEISLLDKETMRRMWEAGLKLCKSDGIEPTGPEVVWRLFKEAADTLRRLPDKDRRYLSAGDRTAWPEIVYNEDDKKQQFEQYEIELERVRSGQDPVEAIKLRLPPPDRDAIDRVDVVSSWHKYLSGKKVQRDWKILWMLASDRVKAKIIAKECHCSVRSVWNTRDWQIKVICQHLVQIVEIPQHYDDEVMEAS